MNNNNKLMTVYYVDKIVKSEDLEAALKFFHAKNFIGEDKENTFWMPIYNLLSSLREFKKDKEIRCMAPNQEIHLTAMDPD